VSVLTKVLFVLLSVSAIALSMLVVGSFSQQQNWKASAEDWQQTAIAAQAKERVAVANAAIEQQRMLAQSKSDTAKLAELQTGMDASQSKIGDLERKLAESGNRLSVEQGQVTSAVDENKLLLASMNREKEFAAKDVAFVLLNCSGDSAAEITSGMKLHSLTLPSLRFFSVRT